MCNPNLDKKKHASNSNAVRRRREIVKRNGGREKKYDITGWSDADGGTSLNIVVFLSFLCPYRASWVPFNVKVPRSRLD